MSEYLTFTEKIIIEAGKETLKYFGRAEVQYTKEDETDVVTQADLASNKIITDAIKKQFPSHGIVSEEDPAYQKESEFQWHVDPLDGTRNFSTHVPLYGVSIALAKSGRVIVGAIYLPVTNELYLSEEGKGTTLNGEFISCSQRKELKNSYGLVGSRLSPEKANNIIQLAEHTRGESFWMNSLGNAVGSIGYVADGRRDWCVTEGGHSWDYAAGYIIATEAGCKVT